MSLLDALTFERFSVNESLLDALLLEPDAIEVFLAIRDDGEDGSGSAWDPYDAGTTTKFDALMNSFPPNTTVHLGAGTFTTRGHADGVSGGWQPKRRFRIVGAGVGVTTLTLDFGNFTPTANGQYFAIGGDDDQLVDESEFADFTIDCNLNGNDGSANPVAAGGIKVFGSHIRIRRLRVINFGTQTTSERGVAISTAGAFPENPEPFDCVVEDCAIEQPYPNSVRESVGIELAGGEDADGVMGYHKGCVVRNCLINCMYIDREFGVHGLTLIGSEAVIFTKGGHGRVVNDWICVTGALIEDANANGFNGSRKITSLVNPDTGAADSQFLHYAATDGTSVPTVDPAGEIFIGRAPSHRIGIQSLALSGSAPNITAELTSRTPHNRLPNQNVTLNNILVGGTPNSNYNHAFPITQLVSPYPTTLQFGMALNPGTADVTDAYIGVDFYGIAINGGRSIILENNRILNTTFGVYHDTGNTKDAIIRDNYFYNVLSAVYFKLGQVSGGDSDLQPTRAGSSLNQNGALATFTTAEPHGFSPGNFVSVNGAIVGGSSSNAFNGSFQIVSVPTPTSFTYAMNTDPGSNASGTPALNGQAAVLLTHNGATASLTTGLAHGFSEGMSVLISGASPAAYNGVFQIVSVLNPTTFTYLMASDPGANASGSPFCNGQVATSLVRAKTLATFNTSAAHGLASGRAIAVAGATPSAYNGVFTVASVPDPTTFTYIMNSDPGSNATGSIKFGALWQVGRLIIENNIMELILPIAGTPDVPTAIRLERKGATPAAPPSPFVFQYTFIRSNVIRHADNLSDSGGSPPSLAIQLQSCANAIIEDNVIKLDRATPIEFSGCDKVTFMNNQSASGALIQGYKADSGAAQFVNELETDVDLGLVSAV